MVGKRYQTPTANLEIVLEDQTGVTTQFAMVDIEIEKAYTPVLL